MRRLAKPLTGVSSFEGSNPSLPATPRRLALLLLALALSSGCVSQKLFLQTTPPGATIFLDGKKVGTTPWEGGYGSYGQRRVELEAPGYVRRIEIIEIETPWWQYPVLAVVTDLLLPWTIHDDYSYVWELKPIDPDAGSWDDARAAEQRMKAAR